MKQVRRLITKSGDTFKSNLGYVHFGYTAKTEGYGGNCPVFEFKCNFQ